MLTTAQETGSRPLRKSLNRKAGRLGAPDRPRYSSWNPQAAMCKWSVLPNPKESCEVLKFHTHHRQTPTERTERKNQRTTSLNTRLLDQLKLHEQSRTPRRRSSNELTAQNNIILLRRRLSKYHSVYTFQILLPFSSVPFPHSTDLVVGLYSLSSNLITE